MDLSIRNSYLDTLNKNIKIVIIAVFTSVLLNFILAACLFKSIGNERIILLPPSFTRSIWVGGDEVSSDYLAEMSSFIANLRFNQTPSSSAYQHTLLLRYVDPKFYSSLKEQLNVEAEYFKKQHIATAFYPVEINIDMKHLQANLTGEVITTVGLTQLPIKRVTYLLSFNYERGRLWLTSFEENKAHG